jgi:ketosteroid isomerase-like protein
MMVSLVSAVCFVLCCSGPVAGDAGARAEIRAVMGEQQKMWNKGSIDGFMYHYWNSDEFTFQSGNKRLRGWETLRAMYLEKYSGENRGTLEFDRIEINMLSSDAAYVLGRWKVVRKDSIKEGLFTLIFRKMEGRWEIVHDHSS